MPVSAEIPFRSDALDPLGALVPGSVARIAGNAQPGLTLAGRRFVVKDVIDVAGFVTGDGNPDWARTHAPAIVHAAVVRQLLDAGCTLVGKAQRPTATPAPRHCRRRGLPADNYLASLPFLCAVTLRARLPMGIWQHSSVPRGIRVH
jgi:hypothetical protein